MATLATQIVIGAKVIIIGAKVIIIGAKVIIRGQRNKFRRQTYNLSANICWGDGSRRQSKNLGAKEIILCAEIIFMRHF